MDVVPSPKLHEREAMLPSLSVDVSVKFTDKFDTVLVKLATGKTLLAVTVIDLFVLAVPPLLSVTVKTTL